MTARYGMLECVRVRGWANKNMKSLFDLNKFQSLAKVTKKAKRTIIEREKRRHKRRTRKKRPGES